MIKMSRNQVWKQVSGTGRNDFRKRTRESQGDFAQEETEFNCRPGICRPNRGLQGDENFLVENACGGEFPPTFGYKTVLITISPVFHELTAAANTDAFDLPVPGTGVTSARGSGSKLSD